MGEILGLGCTHYPGLLLPHERLPGAFHHLLTAHGVIGQATVHDDAETHLFMSNKCFASGEAR